MPRPEGYASMQFDQVDSPGKQVIVECRHCKNKRLARSVASRKVKHLKQCPEFHRFLAELAASNNEELNDVPEELLHGPQRRTASHGGAGSVGGVSAGGSGGYVQQQQQQQQTQTPIRRQFDVSLPSLLDGLGNTRHESLSTPLDNLHNTNTTLDDTPMNDLPTITEPTTAPPTSRPRPSTNTDSVPERAIAFAHRAAQRRKEKLDNLLTRAIYQGSLPFNINDAGKHPAMAEFFKLVDYVPPNRHKIADDVYDCAHEQSDEIIAYTS